MVASLLKVISSGIQDERLHFKYTLYPFQKLWRKSGRFTTQWSRLDFESVPQFGSTNYCRILRKGHIVTRLFLVAEMPDIYTKQKEARDICGNAQPVFGWTNSLGHALIQQLTLDIASERVETIPSRLLEMLDEYNTPLEKVPVLNDLILRKDNGFTPLSFGNKPTPERVVVPLPFWFTRGDPGCALPIDAMSIDEVRIGIKFRQLNGLYYTNTHLPSNTSYDEGSSLWPISGSNFYEGAPLPDGSNIIPGIQMPNNLQLGECFIMAEYVYLDQPEANRFRLADIQVPIVQHYTMENYDTRSLPMARIRLDIPNPTRDIYFMLNRIEAPSYNAHFLATRDLSGNSNTLPNDSQTPWWPDASGLSAQYPGILRPAFSLSNSEPLRGYEVNYQGSLVRFRTESAPLFRSIIPSYEQRKTPWINRYYYNFSLGIQNGFTPFSRPQGEANLDKINNRELVLQLRPSRGAILQTSIPRYIVYVFAETYNIFRVYGGRSGLLFAY
jgi:hypothetical protein